MNEGICIIRCGVIAAVKGCTVYTIDDQSSPNQPGPLQFGPRAARISSTSLVSGENDAGVNAVNKKNMHRQEMVKVPPLQKINTCF